MSVFQRLQYRLFFRRVRKQPTRQIAFPNFAKVKKILLIYESSLTEKNMFIHELVIRLEQDGKSVTAWGFAPKKNILSPILPSGRILGLRDSTLCGNLQKEVIHDLQNQSFDLMIDLTQHECLPLHYVALYAHSAFKAGRHIQDGIHDLLIDMPASDDIEPLYHQIMHYIQTIQSND